MKSPRRFYVYVLFDWLGNPFYVGKGTGNRWAYHETKSDPDNWLKNELIERTFVMIGEVPKVKIREDLTESEAFASEIALIAAIGRLDRENGPLVNMTNGGDGTSGYVYPDYLRQLRSEQFRALRASEAPELKSARSRHAYLSSGGHAAASHRAKEGNAKLTPEERSERARRGNARLTPEQRHNRALRREVNFSAEFKSQRARRWVELSTPKERSAKAHERQQRKTSNERKQQARSGIETRRKKGNLFRGIYLDCPSCNAKFYVCLSDANIRKYCSHACYVAALRKFGISKEAKFKISQTKRRARQP